jgi:drug/metabolite transporter (DMT)-like permease
MSSAWIIFAFLTAILASASSLVEKKTLFKQHALEFSATLSIYTLILSVPFWFLADFSSVSLAVIGLIYLASLLGAIAFLLIAKALRHIEISLTSPFLVFEPAMVAIFAAILLNERITGLQVAGIAVLIVGTYILNSHQHDHFFEPFKHIARSKYIKYILLALVIYALDSILDKKIVGAPADGGMGVSVWAFIALVHFFLAINYILIMIFFSDGFAGIGKGVKTGGWLVFCVAALTIGYRLCQMYTISLPGVLVSLVIPIKRLSALFSTVIGGELFHEHQVLRKSLACTIMIIGAILIVM